MKKVLWILLSLLLIVPASVFAETEESFSPPGDDFSFEGSSGMPTGMAGLSSENFSADDIPPEYLEPCEQAGRVEKVRYTVASGV